MIDQLKIFPEYIERAQEQKQLWQIAKQVSETTQSRAVLLYGIGGTGKTSLVRHLSKVASEEKIIWLLPIDIDDSEYWLLPNLERRIAEDLKKKCGNYFGKYLEYISQIPKFEQPHLDQATILAHLRRGDEVFVDCYGQFVQKTGLTVVITLDTVEAIRGTDMVLTITQWMKKLSSTLFILVGRPLEPKADLSDPIEEELKGPHLPLPYEKMILAGFTLQEALGYLQESEIASGLSSEEKEKIVLLTQRHPLWLALTLDYLAREGIPAEVEKNSIEKLKKLFSDLSNMPQQGKRLHEEFIRHLIVPYRETDFRYEAIKRLAVVRQRLDQIMGEQLMADYLTGDDFSRRWDELLQLPWIRRRANERYITLQDAVAEELAHRIISLQDKEEGWRRQQWQKVTQIYAALIKEKEQNLKNQQDRLDTSLRPDLPPERQRELMKEVAQLDVNKRELYQLKAEHLYYQILCDPEKGCQLFIKLFDETIKRNDFRFLEPIWIEMQRFLPGTTSFYALEDIVRPVLDYFKEWLPKHPDLDYEIGQRGAKYLIENGQPQEASQRLEDLLQKFQADPEKAYHLLLLQGNAFMQIPGKFENAEIYFKKALALTKQQNAPQKLQDLQGKAHKELGFYYRHKGDIDSAAREYDSALRVTPFRAQEERASIQSNMAYVQALRGQYTEARDAATSALIVRRRRKFLRETGMTLSTVGEIYRYERRFPDAWQAYKEAENIFSDLGDWPWLGVIYQEQAICLFQAILKEEFLEQGQQSKEAGMEKASKLILQALELCSDLNVRAYPAALNRAGRIISEYDRRKGHGYSRGLTYLKDGINWAKNLKDGWFLLANLVEFAELNYHAWIETKEVTYHDTVTSLAKEIENASKGFYFPALKGRWELLQGHLKVYDALATSDMEKKERLFNEALKHYKEGFPLIAEGFIGSHGIAALSREFSTFNELFNQIPRERQEKWCEELNSSWKELKDKQGQPAKHVTPLFSHLTEIYETFVAQTRNEKEVE